MKLGTWPDSLLKKFLRVSATPEMHLGGRHLEFKMATCFHVKPVKLDIIFAINFSLKLVKVSILTIKHL